MRILIKQVINIVGKNYFLYFLLVLMLLAGFAVRLYKIDNPVADWHSWRQADTASVSKIYVEKGIDLLYPRYHDVSNVQTGYFNPEGYRYVEFPIFNYFHAMGYKLFTQIPFDVWGRLISVFSALFTAYFLFEIGKREFNKWVGLLSAFFYLLLPFNVYFTRVILPDPMSVMFGVGSVFFFVLFCQNKKNYNLILSSITFGLGMLVKPHAVFFALPIIFLAFKYFKLSEMFKNKWFFIAVNLALIPFLLWRVWVYQEGLLRGIAHWEWAFNGNGIRFKPSFFRWIFDERLGQLILGVWGILPFGYGALAGKKLINVVHAFLAGALLYVVVFATANVTHDYYQVFIVPAVSLALGLGVYSLWTSKFISPVASKFVVIFSVGMMFLMSFYNTRVNYKINDTGILLAGKEVDALIPKEAWVIAPYNGDTTFLYQTNRFGWPVITGSIDDLIGLGADYYVSVNLTDKDTIEFRNRFQTLKETDRYIIIDLQKEKSAL